MRLFTHRPRHKLLLIALGAGGLVAIGVLVGFVVLLSGSYSIAATKQHFWITHRLLDLGLDFSVRTSAAHIQAPPLEDPALIDQGAACYVEHCAQCHDSPSGARDDLGKGMLPSPTSLAQAARERSAAQLYYITAQGVRMTGMPAWRYRMSEPALWSTVAFVQSLPRMSRADFDSLAQRVANLECPPNTTLPQPAPPDFPKILLRQYSCDSCHRIEGVVGPRTHVGPPLTDWRRRRFIAGVLPNTRANTARWIREPHEVSPATLMPDLNVPEAHARVMADYLFEKT